MNADELDTSLAAFHEAGHAVAFLEVGLQIESICIDPYEGYTNPVDQEAHRNPEFAFVLYAGPWAHAQAKSGDVGAPSFESVTAEMQANLSDWRAYEETMPGGDVAKVDRVDLARLDAYWRGDHDYRDIDPPPIAPPREGWSESLMRLLPKIKQLANEMLAAEKSGATHPGFLGGELPLVRVAPHHWRRVGMP